MPLVTVRHERCCSPLINQVLAFADPNWLHDNSRVGLGATIPQGRPSLGLEKLGRDLCPATLGLGGYPIQRSDLVSPAEISAELARP